MTPAEILREVLHAPRGAHLAPEDAKILTRSGWYQILTPSVATEALNEVLLAQLTEGEADAVIDATLAQYRAAGLPWKWVVGPDSLPADLADRLRQRSTASWLARGMNCVPSELPRKPIPPEIQITRVCTRDELATYCQVIVSGWELPRDHLETLETVCQRALTLPDPRHHFLLACYRGEPAAVASYVRHPRSVYLTAAVVLPSYRGRGLYRALLAARLEDAVKHGVRLVTTQAREATSAPILARLGFETTCRLEVFAGT